MQSDSAPSPSSGASSKETTARRSSFVPFRSAQPLLSLSLYRPDAHNANDRSRFHQDEQPPRNLPSNPVIPRPCAEMQEDSFQSQGPSARPPESSRPGSLRMREESLAGSFWMREEPLPESIPRAQEDSTAELGHSSEPAPESLPTRESGAESIPRAREDFVAELCHSREPAAESLPTRESAAESLPTRESAAESLPTRESAAESFDAIESSGVGSVAVQESLGLWDANYASVPLKSDLEQHSGFRQKVEEERGCTANGSPLLRLQKKVGVNETCGGAELVNEPLFPGAELSNPLFRNLKPSFDTGANRSNEVHRQHTMEAASLHCHSGKSSCVGPCSPSYDALRCHDLSCHSYHHGGSHEQEKGQEQSSPLKRTCFGIDQASALSNDRCNGDILRKLDQYCNNGILFHKLVWREKPVGAHAQALLNARLLTEMEEQDRLSHGFVDGDTCIAGEITENVDVSEHVKVRKDGDGPEFEDMSKSGGIGYYVNGGRSYNEVISQDGNLEHSQAELKADINLADSESFDDVNGLQTGNPARPMDGGDIQSFINPESPLHHRISKQVDDATMHLQSGTKYDVEDSILPPNGTNDDANNGVHLHSGANSDENGATQICRGVDRNDNGALPLQSGIDADADDVMRIRGGTSSDASDGTLPQSGISKDIVCLHQRGIFYDVKCPESGIHPLNGHRPLSSTSDDIPDDSMCTDAMHPPQSSTLEDDAMRPQSGTSDDDMPPLNSTLGKEMQPLSCTLDMEMQPLSSTLDKDMPPPQSGISDNVVLDRSGNSNSDDAEHLRNGKSDLVACLQNGTCLGGAPSGDVTPVKASPSDDSGPSHLTLIQDGHSDAIMTHVQSADSEKIEEGNMQAQNYDHGAVGSPLPHDRAALSPQCYPSPLATHEAVVKDRELFMKSLGGFLVSLGTRLTVPMLGGKELDLHGLYCQVTSRGGLEQVIRSERWKEVSKALNMPSALINASFILRKHYLCHLFHYEKVYYSRAEGKLSVELPVPLPSPSSVEPREDSGSLYEPPPEIAASLRKRKKKLNPLHVFGVDPAASIGAVATGAITGKVEEGYLITAVVGAEKLSGVLYHFPVEKGSQQYATIPSLRDGVGSSGGDENGLGMQLYRKKRKEYVRKKDPDAPKRTRTGYNIFFKEQRARLKQLYPELKGHGKTVIDMWNKLPEKDKALYIARGNEEREKYLEEYRERRRLLSETPEKLLAKQNTEAIADDGHGPYDASHDYRVSLDAEMDLHEDTSEKDASNSHGSVSKTSEGQLVCGQEVVYEIHEDEAEAHYPRSDDDGEDFNLDDEEDVYEDGEEAETIPPGSPPKQVLEEEEEEEEACQGYDIQAAVFERECVRMHDQSVLAYVPTMQPQLPIEVSAEAAAAVMQPRRSSVEHANRGNGIASKLSYRRLLNDDEGGDNNDMVTAGEAMVQVAEQHADARGYGFSHASNPVGLPVPPPPREREQASVHSQQEGSSSGGFSIYNHLAASLHPNRAPGLQASFTYPMHMCMYGNMRQVMRPDFARLPYPALPGHFGNMYNMSTGAMAQRSPPEIVGPGPVIEYKAENQGYSPIMLFKDTTAMHK